jgi:general secretion pathway protein I
MKSVCNRKSGRKKNQGFTILEVLIAMAILAVAGVAVTRASTQNLNSLIILQEVTYGSWVAENRLVEMQLEDQWPPARTKKGKVELAGSEWHWQQMVEPVADKSMRKVTIFVRANETDEEPLYQLSTFLGDPK